MKNMKLATKLVIGAALALVIGLLVFRLVNVAGYSLAASLEYGDYYNRKMQQNVHKIQKYIDDNKISSTDFEKLQAYSNDKNWYILGLYEDKKLIFDSSDGLLPADSDSLYEAVGDDILYSIRFKDKTVQMYVYTDVLDGLYSVSDIVAAISGSVVFIILIILMIRKKMRYLVKLEHEMRILEEKGLDHEITVSGNDELGNLAKSINDMRMAVVYRQKREAEAEQANKDLITAVSHDLRTPLTSLLGYIELISSKKYKDEQQLEYFVSMCRDKVIHIKDMTDQLFEYAYVDSHSELQSQNIDAYEYIQQLLSEMIFELENSGAKVYYEPSVFVGTLCVQPNELVRVFENMVSNIKKYADKNETVKISCYAENRVITIMVSNRISGEAYGQSGTQLGLKTCKRILERHNGSFETSSEDNTFNVTLKLPYTVTEKLQNT